jgi:exodeoxyribonuclease-3
MPSMKVISWNVNGLRAVYKKGFLSWLKGCGADIVCLQEIKIQENQVPFDLVDPHGYKSYFNFAERKGYSGTAVYVRSKSAKEAEAIKSIGLDRFDNEGRLLQIEFPKFTLLNLYMPHGSRDKRDLYYKFTSYGYLLTRLKNLKSKKLVLAGDFNIAHKEIDLARPKDNKNNIMFTPQERAQLDELLGLGFIDSFRSLNKEGGNYTWWPYYNNARERNIGWRLDYIFVSKILKDTIKGVEILKNITKSDHCPIFINIKL